MSIAIYKGYHSQELYNLLQKSWQNNQLLIVCPPHIEADSFIQKIENPESFIFGVFTSGTLSGKPRLILYSKKNIESSLKAIRSLFQTEKITKIFCYPQPTHTFGLILGYLQSIVFQTPLVFFEGAYSNSAHQLWFDSLSDGLLTLGAPAHFLDLLKWTKSQNLKITPSYSCIIGGAPVSQKLWDTIQSELNILKPSIGYGASEASPGLMHLAPGQRPDFDSEIGQVLEGVTITDLSEQGFYFNGDNLCSGIVDEYGFKVLEKVFIRDDLTCLKNSRYIFNGRSDLMINRGGIKVSPEFIEASLFSKLGLKTACVSIFDPRLGEDLGLILDCSATESVQTMAACLNLLITDFNIKIPVQNIKIDRIPLTANAKIDRVESLRLVLKNLNVSFPISVQYLKNFLPHRAPAVWVHRVIDCNDKGGRVEVDLNKNQNIFSENHMRESSCIELVAQAYGYSKAAFEVFRSTKLNKANKTLIAEIRNCIFNFDNETHQMIDLACKNNAVLEVEAQCTHDFGTLRVISGKVILQKKVLAEINMKAFISE